MGEIEVKPSGLSPFITMALMAGMTMDKVYPQPERTPLTDEQKNRLIKSAEEKRERRRLKRMSNQVAYEAGVKSNKGEMK
jgi:hypothetical protein